MLDMCWPGLLIAPSYPRVRRRMQESLSQDVVESAAAIGGPGLQLSPLDIDLTANGTGSSKVVSKTGAAKGEGAAEADEAGLLTQLRQRLLQGLAQAQQQQHSPLMACLKVSSACQKHIFAHTGTEGVQTSHSSHHLQIVAPSMRICWGKTPNSLLVRFQAYRQGLGQLLCRR